MRKIRARYRTKSAALVVVAYSRVSIEILGSLWLTSSPSVLGFTRTLGSSDSRPPGPCRREPSSSSPVLPTHLSGFSSSSSLPPEPKADSFGPVRKLLASLRAPSALFQRKAPFLHSAKAECLQIVPRSAYVSPPGFGYPLGAFSLFPSGEFLSTPNALGVHPSELFSDLAMEKPFRVLPPLLRFIPKPSGLKTALQRLAPARSAVLFAPESV